MSHYGGTQRWQSLKTQELFARYIMPMLRAKTKAEDGFHFSTAQYFHREG